MFFCVQKDARSVTFSYRRARFAAAALAQQLAKRGYGRGTTLACNLYNGAEIVILSLAAAYGGFTLALLNPRLSYEERKLRIVELENATGEAGLRPCRFRRVAGRLCASCHAVRSVRPRM